MRRSPWRSVKCSAWRGPYQASRRPLGAAWTPTPLGSVRRLLLPREKVVGLLAAQSLVEPVGCQKSAGLGRLSCSDAPPTRKFPFRNEGNGCSDICVPPDKPQLLAELRQGIAPRRAGGSSDLAFGPVRVAPRRARAAGWLIRMAPQNDRAAEPVAGGPSGGRRTAPRRRRRAGSQHRCGPVAGWQGQNRARGPSR